MSRIAKILPLFLFICTSAFAYNFSGNPGYAALGQAVNGAHGTEVSGCPFQNSGEEKRSFEARGKIPGYDSICDGGKTLIECLACQRGLPSCKN